jgi:hypothetical protein
MYFNIYLLTLFDSNYINPPLKFTFVDLNIFYSFVFLEKNLRITISTHGIVFTTLHSLVKFTYFYNII